MFKNLVAVCAVLCVVAGCDNSSISKTVSKAEPASAAGNSALPLAPSLPTVYASLPKKNGGACGFDQPKVEGENQFVSGWAAISTTDGVLADATMISISANGTEKFAVVSKQKRDDVANYFKNSALAESGFSAYINKAEVPTGAKATRYQMFQGTIYSCTVTQAF